VDYETHDDECEMNERQREIREEEEWIAEGLEKADINLD